ncbi:MAG: helix-turn-helix domain-containing protein [Pseudomonadota bacterium]
MVAANCNGTLLLAETGLLAGKTATTAWWLENVFRRRYPKVRLDTAALIAEYPRLMTTGAMTANLNRAMNLVSRFAGPQIAAACSRTMLIDGGTQSQQPYQDLMPPELSSDPRAAKARYWMYIHMSEAIDQLDLARKVNVSQRTLIRKFRAELGQTPLTYLQNRRIEAAKRLLGTSKTPLSEVVHRVGYADVSSFSRLFKSKTPLTPKDYRQKFARH